MKMQKNEASSLLKNLQANLSAARRDFEAFLLLMRYINAKQDKRTA